MQMNCDRFLLIVSICTQIAMFIFFLQSISQLRFLSVRVVDSSSSTTQQSQNVIFRPTSTPQPHDQSVVTTPTPRDSGTSSPTAPLLPSQVPSLAPTSSVVQQPKWSRSMFSVRPNQAKFGCIDNPSVCLRAPYFCEHPITLDQYRNSGLDIEDRSYVIPYPKCDHDAFPMERANLPMLNEDDPKVILFDFGARFYDTSVNWFFANYPLHIDHAYPVGMCLCFVSVF